MILAFLPALPLMAAAIIPAVVLMILIYRADKREKEPISLLLSLMLQGIYATAFAMVTERLGERLLDSIFSEQTVLYQFFMYFIVVALSEEGFKYLHLYRRTWNSPAFNYQFDAIVYAVFVSLGFALWENIGYAAMYGFRTTLVRAVTAIPGHACDGVFMGVFYGLAKRYDNDNQPQKARLYRRLALLVPLILHGAYDFILSIITPMSNWIFYVFIGVLYLAAFLVTRQISKHDRNIAANAYTYHFGF